MSSYRTPKSGSHHMRAPSTSTPTLLKKHNNAALSNIPNVKINFNLVTNLKSLLINFNKNNEKEKLEYNNLICDIRDAGIEIKMNLLQITPMPKNLSQMNKSHMVHMNSVKYNGGKENYTCQDFTTFAITLEWLFGS
ncbi:uncharacterized protein LOC112686318 [Sipha flava]|uniref:Uncharacterized protein LOC112686318 n=1 Tax=Sipha flava TaxID=143950 RepID=A0A2S2R0V6_9HEMI|nr:uncharacterized protein LOC112686318 [Sipha flava]